MAVLLVHWHESEAASLADDLRAAGWDVHVEAHDGGRAVRAATVTPPDAAIVSLRRLPSHGRETARALAERAATRDIPLIVVDGASEKIAAVLGAAPGAVHTTWEQLPSVLAEVGAEAGATGSSAGEETS